MVELLRWASPHREVTGDGQILPADLPEAAAAAVGVAVAADGPGSVRDVPRLAALWRALDEAELLEWGVSRVHPAVDADVLAGDQPMGLHQLSALVETALAEVLADALDGEVPPATPAPSATTGTRRTASEPDRTALPARRGGASTAPRSDASRTTPTGGEPAGGS